MLLPYANKTKLTYLLRGKGIKVPAITSTTVHFDSLPRSRAYWLRWTGADGYQEAYYSAAGGRPVLMLNGKTMPVTLDELRGLGMVQEKGAAT